MGLPIVLWKLRLPSPASCLLRSSLVQMVRLSWALGAVICSPFALSLAGTVIHAGENSAEEQVSPQNGQEPGHFCSH